MKHIVTPTFVLVAGSTVLSVWTVWYFAMNYTVESFLQGTMGSLFATLLGVLFGVPVALQISRRQLQEQNAASNAAASREAAARKRSLLSHLRRELEENKNQIKLCRDPLSSGGQRSILTKPLRSELWSAFSDSGDLRFIESADLLASLAEAFYQIAATATMEKLLMEVTHFPGIRLDGTRAIDKQILEYITNDDVHLLAAIDKALTHVSQELAKSPA